MTTESCNTENEKSVTGECRNALDVCGVDVHPLDCETQCEYHQGEQENNELKVAKEVKVMEKLVNNEESGRQTVETDNVHKESKIEGEMKPSKRKVGMSET